MYCFNCGLQKSWNCCSDGSIGGMITACSADCPRMSSNGYFKFECRQCREDNCGKCGLQMSWNCCSDASGRGRLAACSADCFRMSQDSFSGSLYMNPEDRIEFKFECRYCKE